MPISSFIVIASFLNDFFVLSLMFGLVNLKNGIVRLRNCMVVNVMYIKHVAGKLLETAMIREKINVGKLIFNFLL